MNETIEVANQVTQSAPVAQSQDGMWGMVIYCVVIMAILYFFMIRPNKKRMAEYQKMLDSIKIGNRVLAAGIYGTVKKINEKSFDVEIAKGVVVEINKNAVASVE
ncbi:MAG: preprotein translocase subunit YajC [Alphaproteobacteria bacterium]|nr:preprotein translocase subunit YajC [Alphaproteobacteria bacterium]MCQ2568092.1 preprotein translocase subunit YajC [Alphaproteobacteria bacterium]